MGDSPLGVDDPGGARLRPVWRGEEGQVARFDRHRRQDDEGRHHVRGRFHRGGESDDKTSTPKPGPAVRRLLEAPTNLHHHRVHEARLVAQLPAEARDVPDRKHGTAARYVHTGLQGHVVPGAPQLHPQGPGGPELPGRLGKHRQGGGFWPRAVRPRRSVHQLGRHQVPDQVGPAGGAQLHPLLVQE
uniref:(northern house mosquito) hypothetical protein n=1 Tax=Culex pipiens TaxID=7175 RepID=A0A8D8FKS2_CULPI